MRCSNGPSRIPQSYSGEEYIYTLNLEKFVKIYQEVWTFDLIGSQVIMKQYLITHLTKVAIEDFKEKYRRLHNGQQNFILTLDVVYLSNQGPD